MTSSELKSAVMDVLQGKIDRDNYGMSSRYHVDFQSQKIWTNNKISVRGNTVYKNGTPIFKIERKYASKKSDGMYKELKPVLKEISSAEIPMARPTKSPSSKTTTQSQLSATRKTKTSSFKNSKSYVKTPVTVHVKAKSYKSSRYKKR